MNSKFSKLTQAGLFFSSNAITDAGGESQMFFNKSVEGRIKKGDLLEITD